MSIANSAIIIAQEKGTESKVVKLSDVEDYFIQKFGIQNPDYKNIIILKTMKACTERYLYQEKDLDVIISLIVDLDPQETDDLLIVANIVICQFLAMENFEKSNNVIQLDVKEKRLNLGLKLLNKSMKLIEMRRKMLGNFETRTFSKKVSIEVEEKTVIGSKKHC